MIQAALHLATAALLCFLAGDVPPLVFIASLLLALAPDLDTPKSLIGRLFKPISVPIERRLGHRSATHSVLALALVAGAAYMISPPWWLVLAGAYASHLLLDLLIGVQGITLFWPSAEWLTLTSWRDDGPAPRIMLLVILPAMLIAATWAQLAPLLTPTISAAAQVANPIATPTATKTPAPAIRLHFELPAGISLSALKVKAGDTLAEGQTIAVWNKAEPTLWPSPTAPSAPGTPAPLPTPIADRSADRALREAQAALDALTTAQVAERAALLADQQRLLANQQRLLAEAQRAIDQLQPQHERDQAEKQHAVDMAHQVLLDANAAQALADVTDPTALQRAAERVHTAEAKLREAIDAQDRMRTDQGIARAAAEAKLAEAQADLHALPEQQRQAFAKLDADHQAAQILAAARLTTAQDQANDAAQAQAREAGQIAVTATAIAGVRNATATAILAAHQVAVTATALAIPTPAPNTIVSHAAGKVVNVSAEEKDNKLIVTLEVMP